MTSSPVPGPDTSPDPRNRFDAEPTAASRRRSGSRSATALATCALTATFAFTSVAGALPALADDDAGTDVATDDTRAGASNDDTGSVPTRLWDLPLPASAPTPAITTPRASDLTSDSPLAVTVEMTDPGDRVSTLGDRSDLVVEATSSDGGPVSFHARGLPGRVVLEPSSGRVLGPLTEVGVFDVEVTARHASGASDTVSFRWTVTEAVPDVAVELTSPGDQSHTVGDAVRLPLEASASDDGVLMYSAVGLPDGLRADPISGVIGGTPEVAGDFAVTVTATHLSTGIAESESFTWRITEATAPITVVVEDVDDQRHAVGEPVDLEVIATASDDSPVVADADGLPDGLSVDPESNRVVGTPTTPGIFEVTIGATHTGSGARGTTSFVWEITETESEPVVTITFSGTLARQAHSVGEDVDLAADATASNDEPLVYSAWGLPDGLDIDAESGRITGKLTTVGEFEVEVTAAELGSSAFESVTFDWSVSGSDVAGAVPAIDPAKPMAANPTVTTLPATGVSGPLGWIVAGAGAMVAAGAALMVAARRRVTE